MLGSVARTVAFDKKTFLCLNCRMICEVKGFQFRDVLLVIGLTGRTGELELESGNNMGSIFFQKGVVLQAFSPYSRAIGDLLVDQGFITESELLETLRLQKNDPNNIPIGAMILKTGKVNFKIIEMMVHEQIRNAMREFESWPNLQMSFIQKEFRPFDGIHLPVHEFIGPDAFKTAMDFMLKNHNPVTEKSQAPAASAPN
jgi:hypothetical protein